MSTDVSEVRAASIIRAMSHLIALIMEAEYTSETSVYIQLRTQQYITEDSELYIRCRENSKSHIDYKDLEGNGSSLLGCNAMWSE
jgi:hypothetical protein